MNLVKNILLPSICVLLFLSCSRQIINSPTEYRVIKTGDLMDMNSEEYLVKNNGWNLQTTDHFKFYMDLALADTIKAKAMTAQEKNYQEIISLMGVDSIADDLILFYLFRDKDQKILLTQVSSDAHAISDFPAVYHLPNNATGGQEVGHVLTQKYWGFIPKTSNYSLVIDEGFNFYIDDQRFYQGELWKQSILIQEKYPDMNVAAIISANNGEKLKGVETGTHTLNESIFAGAFVKFLIEEYGIDRFEKLWKLATKKEIADPSIFLEVYDQELSYLSMAFDHKLSQSQ